MKECYEAAQYSLTNRSLIYYVNLGGGHLCYPQRVREYGVLKNGSEFLLLETCLILAFSHKLVIGAMYSTVRKGMLLTLDLSGIFSQEEMSGDIFVTLGLVVTKVFYWSFYSYIRYRL